MHGRILWQFRDYVQAMHGKNGWQSVLKTAGLEDRVYLAQAYPDEEARSLIRAAAQLSGKPVPAVLQEFGEFTVPSLIGMYAHLIKPEWRSLDVIERAEKLAHSAVRAYEHEAAPPFLRTRRINPRKVIVTYDSPRKMCAFAVGVGIGMGKYFHEDLVVVHNTCMNLGSDHCDISYTLV